MNWYKLFYLMTMADRLQDFFDTISNIFTTMAVVSLIAFVIATIGYSIRRSDTSAEHDKLHLDDELQAWIMFKKTTIWFLSFCIPIAVATWFLWIATPSKKDALLIVAGGAVGTFITTDSSAQKLPSDITNFLRLKIQAEANELNMESLLDEVVPKKDTLKEMSKEELINLIKKQKK